MDLSHRGGGLYETSFYRQDFCGIVRPEILERMQQIYEVRSEKIETGNGNEGEMEH